MNSQNVEQMTAAMIGMPCLLILLLISRKWCRAVAKKVRITPNTTRSALTWCIFGATSWRLALLIFISFPLVLALRADGPSQAAQGVVNGLAFGLLFYLINLLGVWQIARRVSYGALVSARAAIGESTKVNDQAEENRIAAECLKAGLIHRRFVPTVIEGLVGVWLLLAFGGLALTLLLPSHAQRAARPPAYEAGVRRAAEVNRIRTGVRPICQTPGFHLELTCSKNAGA